LASRLNQGAFNLGNATSAFAGELALTDGASCANLPWIGAGLAALGLAFSLLSHLLQGIPLAWSKRRATELSK